MKRNTKRWGALLTTWVFIALAGAVSAAPVTEGEARTAASTFIAADPVGSAVLRGRTVSSVSERDGLWIAALSPSGHVILSGSDLGDPIVGFSTSDFAEPDPDSPAYSYLAGISASLAAQESNGGVRHARWNRLLGGGTRQRLMAADIESPATVVIPPFLQSHYDQCQPYNDYAPVYESSTNSLNYYRGRCPCGCVATAAAQGFRHFRWPARMDRVDSFNHSFKDTNNIVTTFPIRFDGRIPFNWDSLENDYLDHVSVCVTNFYPGGYSWRWESNYDLRGAVQESVRYPIARLVMFADVLAHMSFESGGSGANYGMVAQNAADWYTPGTWVSANDARVPADIANGVPVQVTIPGHAVVGHGWATDGGNTYIYLNYGWGGGNDGYYNIVGMIEEVYVGHYPRAKPQIDPLPKVCGTSLALNWHFPDFYTNNLSGFTVSISKTATTPTSFLDDFSASTGVSSSENGIYVATDSAGYDGKLLFTKPTAVGTYTIPDSYTLTSASVLTFELYSFAALGAVFQIEARFDGGEWTPLCTPALKADWGASGWSTESIYLGSHGGQTAQFRIRNSHSGYYYSQDESRILLDDFMVTNVLAPVAPETRTVGKAARSLALAELTAGATYSFTVTPNVSGALVDGETSESVSTSIAGTRNTPIPGEQTYSSSTAVAWETETLTALGTPEIRSVSSVAEGFYGECGLGTATFSVTCSENVTSLQALPSHLALVSDNDVTVTSQGNGRFTVSVSPSGITEDNLRSRMILTLAARDANGTTAYKDLSLRFAPMEAVAAVTVTAQSASGAELTAVIPYTWFVENGLVSSGAADAAFQQAAYADSDGDGMANWAEYVCQTSPCNADEKLVCSIEVVDGKGKVSYWPREIRSGYRAVVKGTDDLRATEWTTVTTETSPLHFFKVVIEMEIP
ncbi:MAG: C10 family peptidase [Kiritimatiellae bacterium]|nr:C10 family peptidase [Kiritimatiellia bacterium]